MTKPVEAAQTTDPSVACIPSNYSRLIARELDLQVSDLPSLLYMTGLTADQFMQEDTLITSHQQIQIIQNGLGLSNDDTFGLRLGLRLTPPTHGALGFLASSSPDLLMALKALQTYLPTRMNFAQAKIITTENWLEGHCYFDVNMNEEVNRCLSEVFAKIVFDFAEFIVGRRLHEGITYFTHAKPKYSQHYSDYLPGKFEFSAERLMVRIPIELSHTPNSSTNPENYLFAMQQCELMQAKLLSNKNTTQYKIQTMMLSHPPGVLCEDEAAATLFISKRTLARRLQKEGTGFRKIRDEILSQQAADYLRDSNMSVDAIAALLNYHDSTNFRRAFKRWFQKTPDQYRKQL